MIITRTPYRISFFGGGTDYPQWYRSNRGAVLSTTINKYSFVIARRLPELFPYKHRIRYYRREEVLNFSEIEHPVIREVLKSSGINHGIDITHHGDLPARSGMGSSSSFSVGMIHAIRGLSNQMVSKRDLALSAIDLEQNILRESVGSQDQIAAAFGGINRIDFGGQSEFNVSPILISQNRVDELFSWIVLFYTNQSRTASHIAEKKIQNLDRVRGGLLEMLEMVDYAQNILLSKSNQAVHEFSSLLNKQWTLKKAMAEGVTNSSLDHLYELGIKSGAVGGKILGAGSGGFMLFMAPPTAHAKLKENIKLPSIDVLPDFLGSQAIYYSVSGKMQD